MKWFKIWSADRMKKASVSGDTVDGVIRRACEQLDVVGHQIVFEEDGTPIEEYEILQMIDNRKTLILIGNEAWQPTIMATTCADKAEGLTERMEELKQRLEDARAKRKNTANSASVKSLKGVKPELTLQCGWMKMQPGKKTFKQCRGSSGGSKNIQFKRTAKYHNVLKQLRDKFKIHSSSQCFLAKFDGETIDECEFTVEKYVSTYIHALLQAQRLIQLWQLVAASPGPTMVLAGGTVQQETHVPAVVPSSPSTVVLAGGTVQQETHVPAVVPSSPSTVVLSGGTVQQETHVPAVVPSSPSTMVLAGGTVQQETHVPAVVSSSPSTMVLAGGTVQQITRVLAAPELPTSTPSTIVLGGGTLHQETHVQQPDLAIVIQHIKSVRLEQERRSDGEELMDLNIDADHCLLHRSGPSVEVFIYRQMMKGKNYQEVTTGVHGDFWIIPKADMQLLDQIKQELKDSNLVVVCPPLQYWATTVVGTLSVEVICPKVWKLGESSKAEYENWLAVLECCVFQ